MARSFPPSVLTGNRLREGDAVWLTPGGSWTTVMTQAELFTDEARATARMAEVKRTDLDVVGIYLVAAELGPNGPQPVHFREEFRTKGPSNYPHGKQED